MSDQGLSPHLRSLFLWFCLWLLRLRLLSSLWLPHAPLPNPRLRLRLRQINKKTGNHLRQQLVDEVTREPVEGEDKGRGCEYAKNAYLPVEDDEFDVLAIESTHTIEIGSFVPRQPRLGLFWKTAARSLRRLPLARHGMKYQFDQAMPLSREPATPPLENIANFMDDLRRSISGRASSSSTRMEEAQGSTAKAKVSLEIGAWRDSDIS